MRPGSSVFLITLLLAVSPAWAGGWYLMLPPIVQDDRGQPYYDDEAPLSEWQHMGAYDSAAQCEEIKLSQRTGVKGKMVKMPDARGYKRCIASDDPRLAVPPRGPKGN